MKIISAFILIAFAATAQDRMAETLRKGIIEEETRQDLNAAITSYESVLRQFGEERKTAATALFRLAESYRKVGRTTEAIAAYRRLTQEFGDQTALSELSRSILQKTFQIRQQPAPPEKAAQVQQPTPPEKTAQAQQQPPDPKAQAALAQYGAILQKELELAKQYQQYRNTQFQLGAASEDDLAEARRRILRIELQLAAWHRAMTGSPQLAGPDARAREAVRPLLEQELELANQESARAQQKWRLGALRDSDLQQMQMKVLEAQLRLAAFDAGLPEPARAQEEGRVGAKR